MADNLPQVHFNDGEGVDEEDFNRVQSLLGQKVSQRATRLGTLGNVFGMGHTTGRGGDFSQSELRSVSASRLLTPDPATHIYTDFTVSAGGDFSVAYGPQLLIQGTSASTPGTEPTGFPGLNGTPVSYALDDDEIAFTAKARPAVNPRFDSINVRLGFQVTATESRDHEDAGTRALTTTTPNKDQAGLLEQEYQQGAESATPVYPTPTAGYARLMTIKRLVAESALVQDNVYLHSFPMKLKVETIPGFQGWAPTGFQQNNIRVGAIEKNGAGGGSVVFQSRQMHEGCRLVGIGVSFQNMGLDIEDIMIQRIESTASGVLSQVDILNLGDGGPISSTSEGYSFAGLPEFDDVDGNDLPIWGNGHPYGPLFSDKAQNPAEGIIVDHLALTISDLAWAGGELINFVQFFYLE